MSTRIGFQDLNRDFFSVQDTSDVAGQMVLTPTPIPVIWPLNYPNRVLEIIYI